MHKAHMNIAYSLKKTGQLKEYKMPFTVSVLKMVHLIMCGLVVSDAWWSVLQLNIPFIRQTKNQCPFADAALQPEEEKL